MIDEGESLEDCVVRELYEETGIKTSKDQLSNLVLKYQSGHKRILFVIKDDSIDSNISISWEHSGYIWASSDELINRPLVPGVVVAIKQLQDLGIII